MNNQCILEFDLQELLFIFYQINQSNAFVFFLFLVNFGSSNCGFTK